MDNKAEVLNIVDMRISSVDKKLQRLMKLRELLLEMNSNAKSEINLYQEHPSVNLQ